jgi:hypothetical protein
MRIYGSGDVLEVGQGVIRLDSIFVVALQSWRALANKGSQHEAMNKPRVLAAIPAEQHDGVITSYRVHSGAQDPSSNSPARGCLTSYAPESRNRVVREVVDNIPFFSVHAAGNRDGRISGADTASAYQSGFAGLASTACALGEMATNKHTRGRIDSGYVTHLTTRAFSQLQTSTGAFVFRMLSAFGAFKDRKRATRASALRAGLKLHREIFS